VRVPFFTAEEQEFCAKVRRDKFEFINRLFKPEVFASGFFFYLCVVTPIWWQYSKTGHVEQWGALPVQMCLPKGISNLLISIHFCLSTFSSRASIVCSG